MRAGIIRIIIAAVSSVWLVPAQTQDPASGAVDREIIGLVLSGGGARGGAHLGVIKALEELRIPVDVIAGTSIGAAIGGLYASGMTVAELQAFIDGIDWDAAFLNSTPRRLESFRRKSEDALFLLDQRPGLDDEGFSLPVGVVQGQVIDTVMARVTLPVSSVDDFDELAIPFRAVAGDLESGEAVILEGGNLGRALRASMTVPAAMTPIEIDDRLLVDGGIVMNLPVEVARDMGAERIIAIDISDDLNTRDELQSVVNVTTQLTNMLTRSGTLEQIELLDEQDILLVPVFGEEYSSVSFARLAETIDAGYDLVMANRDAFLPYQLSPDDYLAHVGARRDPRITELPSIEFIRLSQSMPRPSQVRLADSVIYERIQDVTLDAPLDVDALEESLNRVYGLGVYQNVRYSIAEDGDRRGLDLDLLGRSWGPSYVQLGLRYTAVADENARFGLAASYVRTAVNELGGEWRATFLLGEEPGFMADWYQPIGQKALTFVNPAVDINSTIRNVFSDNELQTELRLRTTTIEFGVGREFLDWAEVRGGIRTGNGDTKFRVGDPAAVPFGSFHRGELFARFSVDTLDSIGFPREGTYATVEWRGSNSGLLSSDGDYDQLGASVSHARTWGRHTLLSSLRYEATISGVSPVYALYGLGGFRDLSGLHAFELTGQHVSRLGASYYRRIGNLALFPAFVGFSAEVGNVWADRSAMSLNRSIWGGSLWAGVDTPAGPVFLAYGSAEGGDDAFYVFMGRLF
jgi:NTE family protein